MKIPWISREKPIKIISWPMSTAKLNFMGLFLALKFPWIRGIFFMTHEFLQSLLLWPIDLPWKSPELISWPMNFFISLLSWPMNFFKVYFHDPLVSPESHQNEFHAHELQSNSISWANNSFVLEEQNKWAMNIPRNLYKGIYIAHEFHWWIHSPLKVVLMSSSQLLIYQRADFHDPWNWLVMNLSSEGILVYRTK